MAHASIYLNFNGNAEEAFYHYKKTFKTEFFASTVIGCQLLDNKWKL